MSITSVAFLLFLFAVLIAYYLLPGKYQWVILLLASIIFYASCGIKSFIYVLFTATTIYFATVWMQNLRDTQKRYFRENKAVLTKEDKSLYKAKRKKKSKAIMVTTLLINLGVLCTFKYFHFALEQINSVISWFHGIRIADTFSFVVPLGISFYTFQSIGYLVDVFWDNVEAERNYFKVLLFVSFFPQMTQGPISSFEDLSKELFSEHDLEYNNIALGFQRMLWGLMKKMVLANLLAPYVKDVFENYSQYVGISVFIGALMYSVQIYADFSGYMDIMCGLCEMLDIRLTENFNRPYFSKSVAEYWRRWHISLGTWFKKYIYYPIGVSGFSRRIAKNSRAKLGKHFSDTMPATIALLVTWLATGLWHGASWAYIAWGLVNGIFIIASLWMEPVYQKWKAALHIRESSFAWRLFQVTRTFLLVTFIKVLPEVGTLSDGFGLWAQIFTNHTIPHSLGELLPFLIIDYANANTNLLALLKFLVVLFTTGLLLVSSLLQRKKPIRDYFNRLPRLIRIILLAMLFIFICMFGISASRTGGEFMYVQF